MHTDARAAGKLRAFGEGRERWIVAVNMVSEGVDIPRLRVGVYATAAKTPLMFRQIVGRFVRTLAGRPAEHSYLFLPADRLLRAHAAEVETELRHVLRAPAEDDALGLLDEPPTRRESELTEPEPFVPLAADVAPQLALFSGGPPPPPPPVPRGPPSAGRAGARRAPPRSRSSSAAARLRDKRTGLVRTLAGMEGRSPREINTWCNRQTRIDCVDAATVEQLERSIELLQAELDRIGRRARAPGLLDSLRRPSRPHGVAVSTPAFHAGSGGSIPPGGTQRRARGSRRSNCPARLRPRRHLTAAA